MNLKPSSGGPRAFRLEIDFRPAVEFRPAVSRTEKISGTGGRVLQQIDQGLLAARRTGCGRRTVWSLVRQHST
jgi:hypothetical protein